jgi:hypothetical protein
MTHSKVTIGTIGTIGTTGTIGTMAVKRGCGTFVPIVPFDGGTIFGI